MYLSLRFPVFVVDLIIDVILLLVSNKTGTLVVVRKMYAAKYICIFILKWNSI